MKNDIVQSVPSANCLSGEMVKLLSYTQTLARRIKSAIKSSGYCQWVAVTWTRVSERASKRKYIWKLVGYLEFQKSSTLKIILCKEKVKNKSAYLEEILSPFLTVLNLFPFCLTFTDFFPALAGLHVFLHSQTHYQLRELALVMIFSFISTYFGFFSSQVMVQLIFSYWALSWLPYFKVQLHLHNPPTTLTFTLSLFCLLFLQYTITRWHNINFLSHLFTFYFLQLKYKISERGILVWCVGPCVYTI